MNNTILMILSLSISGSALALILLALRPLLKNKVTKTFQYYIWLLVLVRLILPLSFEGSILNQLISHTATTQAPAASTPNDNKSIPTEADIAPQNNEQNAAQENTSPETTTNGTGAPIPGLSAVSAPTQLNIGTLVVEHLTAIWLLGAFLHFSWFVVAYVRFSRKIRSTNIRPRPRDREVFVRLRGHTHVQLACNPYIDTPMLIGPLSPCVVIPHLAFVENGMKADLQHILRHELTHYRRCDLLYKWVVVFVSSLHWFNPLMILVRREMNRSCELACDEAVISSLSAAARQDYGETLLSIASSRRLPTGIVTTTMCEEKRQLKERLESIMTYKSKSLFMAAFSLVLALLLAGCSVALGAASVNGQIPDSQAPIASETTSISTSPSPASLQIPDDKTSPSPAATDAYSVANSPSATPFNGEDEETTPSPEATDVFGVPASPANSVLEAYQAVLLDEAEFLSTDNKKSLYLTDFLTNQELYGTTFKVTHFSALDMDGDEAPEIVLEMSVGEEPAFFEILHMMDDVVYGYLMDYRGLQGLKADGTFAFSSGAADSGWGKLRFGSNACKTESFDSSMEEQAGKSDAVWYAFSQKKIKSELSAN